MRTQKPVNQKSIYHSFADLFDKIMNDEIPLEKAECATKALAGMNRTYALELKRTELEQMLKGSSMPATMRTIELKDFSELPIEETNKPK